MPPNKAIIDDGFNPELVKGARFDGVFEIPCIEKPKEVIIPRGFTPFTKRHKAPTEHEALSFFEFDTKFAECLIAPELFVGTALSFDVFVPTDNSLYRDQPLATQIGNIYRSRAIGFYYQKHGANVYPLIRWGDERTYTDKVFPESVAFAGAPKNSVVVVSTYGCIRGQDNKRHFQAGLESMVDVLAPTLVLVHGSMPKTVFSHVLSRSEFVQFPDWTARMRRGDYRG